MDSQYRKKSGPFEEHSDPIDFQQGLQHSPACTTLVPAIEACAVYDFSDEEGCYGVQAPGSQPVRKEVLPAPISSAQ